MKASSYIFFVVGLTAFSCASAPKSAGADPLDAVLVTEAEQAADKASQEAEVVIDEKQLALDAYKTLVGDVTLSVVSAPKETVAKKAFSAPYVIKALHADGSPASSFSLTVTYPSGRDENALIVFATAALTADEAGMASFTPGIPAGAFNTTVRFSPAVSESDADNEEIQKLAAEKTVEAPFAVHTRFQHAGGGLAIVDFNASGAPIRMRSDSSSALLTNLMKKGFLKVGNADFTDEVASGNRSAVYKAAKNLFGSVSTYLIYGTVKYAEPVKKSEAGYTCTLTADITCLDMRDGSLLYHTTTSATATEKQEWSALTQARTTLTKDVAEQIYYGM
ncbi:MAG: hypothetical protein K6G80_03805 [Treponema sp.]|nr:hypothetical protein [Treponema sp.]